MPSGLQHLKHSTLRTPRKKGIKSEDTSVNLKTPTLNTRNSVVIIELTLTFPVFHTIHAGINSINATPPVSSIKTNRFRGRIKWDSWWLLH